MPIIIKTYKINMPPTIPIQNDGLLEIPQNVEIIYAEPALLYHVKPAAQERATRSCYVFEKPPLHELQDYQPLNDNEDLVPKKITCQTKVGAIENLVIQQQLDSGTEILAQPFEYENPENPSHKIIHPFLMRVCTFKRVGRRIDNMPETGNEIEVQQIGYMYKKDLQLQGKTIKFNLPPFNSLPEKKDITQSGLGDCFLLSALNAILAADIQDIPSSPNGMDFIRSMMKQQADGSVIVRLYDPRDLQPVYVRVESSYLDDNGTTVKHRLPWVHMIEKAYAGLAFKPKISAENHLSVQNREEKYVLTTGSFLSMYGKGGASDLALTVLTGHPATDVPIHDPSASHPFSSSNLGLFVKVKIASDSYPFCNYGFTVSLS